MAKKKRKLTAEERGTKGVISRARKTLGKEANDAMQRTMRGISRRGKK